MWTSYVNIIYKNITCENQESSHVKSYSNLHMWTSYTELQKWWQHTNHNITCDYHMFVSHVSLICGYHMWVSYTKFHIWISHVNITYKNITYEHRWTSHTKSHIQTNKLRPTGLGIQATTARVDMRFARSASGQSVFYNFTYEISHTK